MKENRETDKTEFGHRRPTIGLLCKFGYVTVEGYDSIVLSGIVNTTRERDVNFVCFAGGPLDHDSFEEFSPQLNAVYDLATRDNVNGLIIVSATMVAHARNLKAVEVFCKRYRPLPIISIGLALNDTHSILVDNETGFSNLMTHLIQDHGYRRIAFIRGSEGHTEAEQRYQVYAKALAKYDLSLDSDLVMPGDFLPHSGKTAICSLIDDRQKHPQIDFDAVVAANDYMAFGALEALQERGINVPYDVAVVGFDDLGESGICTPPLTTVRQPIEILGNQAVEMILSILAGVEVAECVTLPTELVVRQSCGCLGRTVTQTAVDALPGLPANVSFQTALFELRDNILSDMMETASSLLSKQETVACCTQQLDAFINDLQKGTTQTFLLALDVTLRQVIARGHDVSLFHEVLDAMRHQISSILTDVDVLKQAENLWHQARVMIGGVAYRNLAHQRLLAEERARTLHTISQELLTTFDLDGLMDAVVREVPRLGIGICYICLNEKSDDALVVSQNETNEGSEKSLQADISGRRDFIDPQTSPRIPTVWSRLILAYHHNKRVELEKEGMRFPTLQLLPNGLLPLESRYTLVVKPLFFRDELFGFILFGLEPLVGSIIHETLRLQISSALKGEMLFQERKQAEKRIQKELKEKEVLLKEINHRVKNNLNVVASLLSLQSNRIQSKEQAMNAFKESRDRIHTMAIIHEKLYKSEVFSSIDMKSYIESMIHELIYAYGARESVTLETKIKDVFLDINTAIPCGLILNELVTNVLKYAFPDERKGKLHISLHRSDKDKYELFVCDDGIGLPQNIDIKKVDSLGLKLVQVLSEQIDGNVMIDRKDGTCFKIIFPVQKG